MIKFTLTSLVCLVLNICCQAQYYLDFNNPQKVYFKGKNKLLKFNVKSVYLILEHNEIVFPEISPNVFCIDSQQLVKEGIIKDSTKVVIVYSTSKGFFYECQPQGSFFRNSYERIAIVKVKSNQYNIHGLEEGKNRTSMCCSVGMVSRTKKSKNIVCKRYR